MRKKHQDWVECSRMGHFSKRSSSENPFSHHLRFWRTKQLKLLKLILRLIEFRVVLNWVNHITSSHCFVLCVFMSVLHCARVAAVPSNKFVSSFQNQEILIESLPNVVGVYHIRDTQFVHGSFAHSPYNMSHLYDVIEFFNDFNGMK